MTAWVAFLRGINLGKRQVKMAELRQAFEALGFQQVRTLLASGNVLFEAQEQDAPALATTIQDRLKETFGFPIDVILRTVDQVRALAEAGPFQGIEVTPHTRLYVTFLDGEPKGGLELPYETPDQGLKILSLIDGALCSVLTLSEGRGTVDAMAVIEKTYGKRATTRNWNTVEKILNT